MFHSRHTKVEFGNLHWLQDCAARTLNFLIGYVMITVSKIVCTGKPPVDDSRDHDGHVTNSKSSKFLQRKAATNATFRIRFYCLEKKYVDFIAVQDLT